MIQTGNDCILGTSSSRTHPSLRIAPAPSHHLEPQTSCSVLSVSYFTNILTPHVGVHDTRSSMDAWGSIGKVPADIMVSRQSTKTLQSTLRDPHDSIHFSLQLIHVGWNDIQLSWIMGAPRNGGCRLSTKDNCIKSIWVWMDIFDLSSEHKPFRVYLLLAKFRCQIFPPTAFVDHVRWKLSHTASLSLISHSQSSSTASSWLSGDSLPINEVSGWSLQKTIEQ